jgi:hypothetical protein
VVVHDFQSLILTSPLALQLRVIGGKVQRSNLTLSHTYKSAARQIATTSSLNVTRVYK